MLQPGLIHVLILCAFLHVLKLPIHHAFMKNMHGLHELTT